MPKMKPQEKKKPAGADTEIEVEPGADKRLANILKKALNTPPTHVPSKRTKRTRASKT
jgi:hypothetical protein